MADKQTGRPTGSDLVRQVQGEIVAELEEALTIGRVRSVLAGAAIQSKEDFERILQVRARLTQALEQWKAHYALEVKKSKHAREAALKQAAAQVPRGETFTALPPEADAEAGQ